MVKSALFASEPKDIPLMIHFGKATLIFDKDALVLSRHAYAGASHALRVKQSAADPDLLKLTEQLSDDYTLNYTNTRENANKPSHDDQVVVSYKGEQVGEPVKHERPFIGLQARLVPGRLWLYAAQSALEHQAKNQ